MLLSRAFLRISRHLRDFDATGCRNICRRGFQLVSYFAKCWGGSIYPTKIGIVLPSCNADYSGRIRGSRTRSQAPRLLHDETERPWHREHPEMVMHNIASWLRTSKKRVRTCATTPPTWIKSPSADKDIIESTTSTVSYRIASAYSAWNCFCPCCRDLYAKEWAGIPASDADPRQLPIASGPTDTWNSFMRCLPRGAR